MATATDVRGAPRFAGLEKYQAPERATELLPFRFSRLGGARVVLTNLAGEHLVLSRHAFGALIDGSLASDSATFRQLRAKHFIRLPGETLPLELLATKVRTRFRRLPQSTGLHIFVVTLRCEHSCPYCQVSRRSADTARYDMSTAAAARGLDLAFRSPSPSIKIEFQGGEPLLNFDLVRWIVLEAKRRNEAHEKDLAFVVATNLALLDDEVLAFAREHGLHFSTSLDGPRDLHNGNRPRPGHDSWELAIAGVERIRAELGADRVSALMTTTKASLGRAREIVDAYIAQGFREIFLRPISPYGFAAKTRAHAAYDVDAWLAFYREGLDRVLELNASGIDFTERFAAILLRKMLTNDDPGYVDLTSPAGIGIGALVYNYDGDVYASDEGRMLAEMGDATFRLGNLERDSYADIMLSEALLDPLEESFALSAPMCTDCAFEPYCGADPVFHHRAFGDFLGKKPLSPFCRRNMALCELLIQLYEEDGLARQTFRRWAHR